jgi:chaperonin GroEL
MQIEIEKGFISPYFATDNENMICEMDVPSILLTSKKITNIQQILNLVEGVAEAGCALFIVADDVEGEALTVLINNKIQGRLKVCAIRAPGFGEYRAEILEDLAVLTNARVITDESNESLEDVEYSPGDGLIGSAERVIIGKSSTIITGGAGDISRINARIDLIKSSIDEAGSEYEKVKLQQRLTNLADSIRS